MNYLLFCSLLLSMTDHPLDDTTIGTILGKSISNNDLNPNLSIKDNTLRLFVIPLIDHYLKSEGIDPQAIIEQRIQDPGVAAGSLIFVRNHAFHKHLYKRHGGRVALSAFGPFAFDAYQTWLAAQEKAGNIKILDSEYRKMLYNPGQYSEERMTTDQATIDTAFDDANIEKFLEKMKQLANHHKNNSD